jgi:putative ABC transport system permease protein
MGELLVLLVVVSVLAVATVLLALRSPVLAKMAARNIARRKAHAAIVVAGLMVGTALISSSLVVGDTLSFIFTEDVFERWHLVDELVAREASGRYFPFPFERFETLRARLLAEGAPVDGVAPMLLQQVAVQNEARGLWSKDTTILAVDSRYEGGFGELVTRDGIAVTTDDLAVGEAILNARAADALGARPGEVLRLYYVNYTIPVTVAFVVEDAGAANWDRRPNVFLRLEDAQLAFREPGGINVIKVSNAGGVEDGAGRTEEVTAALAAIVQEEGWTDEGVGMRVLPVKADGLRRAGEVSEDVTQSFLIMTSFAIAAGMLLIVNLFVMVAEERKAEMGVSRAVGMTRRQLMQTFLFEGAAYAAGAAAIGAVLGLVLGYVMVYAFGQIFPVSFTEGVRFAFAYEPGSVLLAFLAGVLLTYVAVVGAAWRVSRVNIVRAMRDLAAPPGAASTGRLWPLPLLVVGAGVAFLLALRSVPPAYMVSVPLVALGVAWLALRWLPPRLPFTLAGLVLVVWTLGPRFVDETTSDPYLPFVVAGLLVVLGASLVAILNASEAFRFVVRRTARRRGRPVLQTAVAYPTTRRFRMGMTLVMFSLVLFAVTVISMLQTMQAAGIVQAIQEQSGGYDIITYTPSFTAVPNFREEIDRLGLAASVRSVSTATVTPVVVTRGPDSKPTPYTLWGVDNVLIESNEFGFIQRLPGYYDAAGAWHPIESQRDVWRALASNRSLAVVDGSVLTEGNQFRFEPGVFTLAVGDTVTVGQPGASLNLTILAIMKQELPGTRGLFVDVAAMEGFERTWTAYFLVVDEDADPYVVAAQLEARFRTLETVVIEEVVGQVIDVSNKVLLLIQGYLALGLTVGVAGLAVVAVRAVVERRQQIGAIRAIGFTRRMVLWTFLLEMAFVASVGVAVGIAMGVVISWKIWFLFFRDVAAFVVPWDRLVVLGAVAFAASLAATASPALRASRLPPAEALRVLE